MTIINDPGQTGEIGFVAVVNDHGQHALWRADLGVPPGWRRESATMSRSDCLDAIAAMGQDITPASVRGGARRVHQPDRRGHDPRLCHELFAERAARQPGATAVVSEGTRLTYAELDRSANRLAHYLRSIGGGPETLVGVCLERGADTIRSLLAIMKAGCGYLPLDPSLPPARLARICSQARPMAVLGSDAEILAGTGTRLLPVGQLASELAGQPGTAPDVAVHPDSVCYAIHTSGSTGQPKAVAVSHGSLACVITEISREYQISPADRVVQLASLAFDTSIEQVLATLTRGATLMLPPPGTLGAADLLSALKDERVTVVDLTPAYWHRLLAIAEPDDERLRSVRLMITGGDKADPADCAAALRAAPRARLLNAYGLTETTITSALFDISAAPEVIRPRSAVPVGRAVRHARIMVLDDKLNPVPAGELGEIYIGGCGVARGYPGQPALTAEMFLPDRYGVPGGRMYRTGDLGCWGEGGNLEVAGRIDRQLKVRGFRVDPAEIEAALSGHPDIGQVTVAAARQGPDTRLVAYYTLGRGTPPGPRAPHPPSPASLRHYLQTRLPGYMLPAAFVARDRLPPAPEAGAEMSAPDHAGVPAPAGSRGEELTPPQAAVSALWSRLLKSGPVVLDDDFFQLGGDSLLAAEMLAHTRTMFGISADQLRPLTRSLLRDPTLRGFADAAQRARAGSLAADGGQARVDFAREAQLGVTVRPHSAPGDSQPDWQRPREVLLTGATGFLGAHLLRELLAATTARVWCLVRADDAAGAMRRIADAAARYDLPEPSAARVVPLPGDLAAPQLGLSPRSFRDLARGIDVIYHAGALVNFIYPYEELRAANVAGTRELIRLAGLYRGIPVHYVSTTAVLAGLGVAGVREVTEETPLAHPGRLCVGYVETKFVAEELLRNAARAGLPVAVYRPLDIVGSRRTGAWNTATEMCALIRFITDTGLAPDIDLPLDFVAADVCAAAIRHISATREAAGRTYHLASPKYTMLRSLVDRLRDHGYPVTEIPLAGWVRELARFAADNPSHPMTAFLPLFLDRDQESGLTAAEMYLEHIFPSYGRSNTEQALRGSGISFAPVDGQLLDRNISRLIRTGYLSAPRGQSASR